MHLHNGTNQDRMPNGSRNHINGDFMNLFTTLEGILSGFKTWWKGTTIGQEIDSAGQSGLTELEALAPEVLDTVAQATSAGLLTAIASGGNVAAILSAGATAAETALKTAGVSVASTTVSTLVSTLHNSVMAQQTPTVPTAAS